MRICYVLLSPTFGMHQYTADLANRLAEFGHDVHLVTTTEAPRDRYTSSVQVHAPMDASDTGFSIETLRFAGLRAALEATLDLHPDVVHFSGPHAWNLPLMRRLKSEHVPILHTLHDLDPHSGSGYGVLLRVWNQHVIRVSDHILVHGQTYYRRMLDDMEVPSDRVTSTPLLHLFVGGSWLGVTSDLAVSVEYQPWALFFGRLKEYKGLEYLFTACAMMDGRGECSNRIVVAGLGDLSKLWAGSLPARLEVHNYLIHDEEAMDLFSRCGLLVLPYVDATQSALVAAAYYFRKPVIVTRTGALPEYVEEGVTGYVVEPDHPASLARQLEEMLDDPERLARMGEAGRAWYEARRAEEEAALIQVYARLAEARGTAGRSVLIAALEGDHDI
jgi:glycosyltransferase involved in cell wall biosynthesis